MVERTRLTCAVGIGETKERAKMATAFAKASAERVFRLSSANWMMIMGERPVTELWGIGKRTGARLSSHGIATVTDLATADRDELARLVRSDHRTGAACPGPRWHVADGGGRGAGGQVAQPAGHFPRDLTDAAEIREQVASLAGEVLGVSPKSAS